MLRFPIKYFVGTALTNSAEMQDENFSTLLSNETLPTHTSNISNVQNDSASRQAGK